MRISVLYFAGLRAAAGVASEELQSDAASLTALYEELRARHGWSFAQTSLRVAVNDELVPWTRAVQEGDVIAFLPPFSGG